MKPTTTCHHYNPDWLTDDDLLAGFVARMGEFTFLRDELARIPREGTVQHHLLVGVRGSGKTTLLKRLAIALRRDADLADHLIALSFPEELYQVKNLADFWWAACEALADELDRRGDTERVERLLAAVDDAKGPASRAEPLSDAGLQLLLGVCEELGHRPVLLVDNLDLIFQRIDKRGRKLKDPNSPAYWALREALSTDKSPTIIGGSVRLGAHFTEYDMPFYDFFIPKRLGKLPREEVGRVLERLAEVHAAPEVKDRLMTRPSRVDALYELTGGNPRALGLIFELLRQGANSRAVEDFERLMDITTPYYKARFEDLAEQAQVVMHALAVRRSGPEGGLHFGHTAAEIGAHAGLPTGTVSAQMDVLGREGLVERDAGEGRTQYRIAEQLFRLWLQMRGSRRIRQHVIGLTEFLQAMFDHDELVAEAYGDEGPASLAEARFSFAVADTLPSGPSRRGLEARGASHALTHTRDSGITLDDCLPPCDLPEDLHAFIRMRDELNACRCRALTDAEQSALLGSVRLTLEQKQESVKRLCDKSTAEQEAARLRPELDAERRKLLSSGLHEMDLSVLFDKRLQGLLPLPDLLPTDIETAFGPQLATQACGMVWRLVGAREHIRFASAESAQAWLDWGLKWAVQASSTEWANVAGTMRRSKQPMHARTALEQAISRGESARSSYEHAVLAKLDGDPVEAEAAFRRAIELDALDGLPWNGLGNLLADQPARLVEAEAAYRTAIELDAADSWSWNNLGVLLARQPGRQVEAEAAYRQATELDATHAKPWMNLGNLLAKRADRRVEAEAAYCKAIELDAAHALAWNNLGRLLAANDRLDEASSAYARATELEPDLRPYWLEQHANLQTRRYTFRAQQALAAGDPRALRDALTGLLAESPDVSAALVSEPFVEQFLAPALAKRKGAAELLSILRELGYDKRGRPLLLAFEAIVENRVDKLATTEPEVQAAALHMFGRLTRGMARDG